MVLYTRVAHRGGSRLAPENTMGAFRHALTMPIDAIELDVQMSRDGVPVVFHDSTVARVTNGEGNILDLDFAYLQSLNAAARFPGGWPQSERIPTLSEVLALAKNRVQVFIEVKASERSGVYGRYPQIVEAVVREIKVAGMLDQVLIISFDWDILQEMKHVVPDIPTAAVVSTDLWNPQDEHALDTLLQKVTALGCGWIDLDHKLFTADLLAAFHERDLKVGLWTVNSLAELQRYAIAGVDALTSDRPDFFAEVK